MTQISPHAADNAFLDDQRQRWGRRAAPSAPRPAAQPMGKEHANEPLFRPLPRAGTSQRDVPALRAPPQIQRQCPTGRGHSRLARAFAAPLCLLFCLWLCLPAAAAEQIPPRPDHYFNDYAHVVSPATASRLNQQLKDFERKTSEQILVVIYPKMESDSSIEDYTVRVAQSWKIGQKASNNGAVLFVFIQDRKMFLQVGYGLEGALPDALAKRIIENEIKPHFRTGDYDGGLSAGVAAILAATQGEYKGTGHTAAEQMGRVPAVMIVVVFVVLLVAFMLLASRRRTSSGWIMNGGGWGTWGGGGWGNWGGGGGGSWGGGGGGGGDFSAGGGSFGGGGAGGSW